MTKVCIAYQSRLDGSVLLVEKSLARKDQFVLREKVMALHVLEVYHRVMIVIDE